MKITLFLIMMVLLIGGAQAQELDIDVSEVPMIAKINTVLDLSFYVVDDAGDRIDPDELSINVRHPDGLTIVRFEHDEITRVDVGHYQFTYEFDTLEKYSFDITAEKDGYVSDFCKATVAVNEIGDTEPSILVVAIVNIKYVIIGCGFLCLGIVILDKKHRPRKVKNGDSNGT